MILNNIRAVPIDEILINRESRQRTVLTADSVLELAVSIANSQWVNPILVDEDTNHVIAGERRLTAVRTLRNAMLGDYTAFADTGTARSTLAPVCTCNVNSWDNWNKIPVQFGRQLSELDLTMFEFIENAHRQDLSWQDRAKAIYTAHAHGKKSDRTWTAERTAKLLGCKRSWISEHLSVYRLVVDGDPEVVKIFEESTSAKAASANLSRFMSRREEGDGISLFSRPAAKPKAASSLNKKPGPAPGVDVRAVEPGLPDLLNGTDEAEAAVPLADKLLLNADFNSWAAAYDGPQFNFLHCDFPYGISFNKGEQGRNISSTMLGNYNDSEDVYWQLLETLKTHKDSLIAPQAHIMFWFSQNLRRETEDFFTKLGGTVQPFLLVWHCSDLSGLIPDPQRYGRRTYETAMLVTFGDRKIVAPRAISISASRDTSTRVHRSQKPLVVLEHFFEMFVDPSSIMLDPTAGSGTSALAAYHLKAKHALGLEIDPAMYKNACSFINSRKTGLSL